MSGKELSTIYQDKISFGSNMPIWKSSLDNILKLEMSSLGGWSGVLDKKHGCLSLNSRKEWDNHKMPKLFSIAILRLFHILIHTLKLLSSR